MAEEQLVVFRLGKEEYAVSIAQVREIIRYGGATHLPNTPAYLEGVINLRGKVIPVIELIKRFGLAKSDAADKYVVIVETGDQDVGIVVDEVSEVIRLAQEYIEPAPAMLSAGNQYVRGVGKDGNRLLILLDLEKVLSQEEVEQLKKVG